MQPFVEVMKVRWGMEAVKHVRIHDEKADDGPRKYRQISMWLLISAYETVDRPPEGAGYKYLSVRLLIPFVPLYLPLLTSRPATISHSPHLLTSRIPNFSARSLVTVVVGGAPTCSMTVR